MWKCVLLCCFISAVNSIYEMDKYINLGAFICPREEEAFSKCLKEALNHYIPGLVEGVPAFNIPPMDPIIVPSLTLEQGSGPIQVISTFRNVTVTGTSTMEVTDLKVFATRQQMRATIHIPELNMGGHYEVTGQILMMPIQSEGDFRATYGDIDAVVTIDVRRHNQPNGIDNLVSDNVDVKFHVGTANMQLENLAGRDGELSQTLTIFLNDNWDKILAELQVPLEEALEKFLTPFVDLAFSTIRADNF